MAKAKHSKNSLKALDFPLQQFLIAWGDKQRAHKAEGTSLPAPYQLAALRGEAVLRHRFFNEWMQKHPVTFDATQQIALWAELVEEGGHITAWVQRLGIAKALRREAILPENAAQESRTLYCILLDALNQQSPELLAWAVEGYFWHIWKNQFPEASSPTGEHTIKTNNAETLKDQLTRALRKQHNEIVTVKESFKSTDEQVDFSLLFKRKSLNQWQVLLEVRRPKLKNARLLAYETALKQLKL